MIEMEKRKMRILFLVSTLNVANGVNSFVMNYMRKMNHEEVQVDVLMFLDRKSSYIDEIRSYGGNVYLAPPVSDLKKHIAYCDGILKTGNYDVIHDNTLIVSIPTMLLAKKRNIQLRILHSHATKIGETFLKQVRNSFFLPILKSTATQYFACSEAAGKAMFGKHKYMIVPNVVNAEDYAFDENKRNSVRRAMGVEGKKIVATVGRCAMQKNPFFALDVMKECVTRFPNIEYWWIGNGKLFSDMKEYLHQLGIEDNVKLLGERTDVKALYQAMDCLFLPSLFEGLPVTCIEAQAAGLPIVMSDTITREVVITNLVETLSLKNNTLEEWADTIQVTVRKSMEREYYSNLFKSSKYSDSGCGEKLIDIYVSLMKNEI